jgi:S1-C subfamily serine protease
VLRTGAACAIALAFGRPGGVRAADAPATIERVKPGIVALGTFEPARSPQFEFRATGFAVGDGTLIVSNAHVVPTLLNSERRETFGFIVPRAGGERPQYREAKAVATDPAHDLTLLRVEGSPLPVLRLGDSDAVREGQEVLFTGFPIGAVLGAFAATHRGIISAITPIAIPQAQSTTLNVQLIRRLAAGGFVVFQLDATAYPGNSGSPVYDPDTGAVLAVLNMVLVRDTKESALTHPSGISYAVPVRYVRDLLERVK